jgi:hypothetical protein
MTAHAFILRGMLWCPHFAAQARIVKFVACCGDLSGR